MKRLVLRYIFAPSHGMKRRILLRIFASSSDKKIQVSSPSFPMFVFILLGNLQVVLFIPYQHVLTASGAWLAGGPLLCGNSTVWRGKALVLKYRNAYVLG